MKNRFFAYFTIVMCAVFVAPAKADPIAGYGQTAVPAASTSAAQSPRATSGQRYGRTSAETNKTKIDNAVIARSTASRSTTSRPITQQSKNVVSRNNNSRTTTSRTVRSRSATSVSPARVSVSGASIRASVSSSTTSLASKLYTGAYSNIIDPTTGLISADAYSNCLESYYTCMDEICAARNPGQRRCACAGRVKTFANVESQLQKAKEDLLKVSGQLSLLLLTKGKDVTDAFTLTEAEKVLNCVSWRDATTGGTESDWCETHTLLAGTATCTSYSGPPAFVAEYCSSEDFVLGGSDWMNVLNGSDSDILAGLETYADTINEVNVITTDDSNSLWSSYMNVNDIVGELDGTGDLFNASTTSADTLATLWGYNLFQYAHNNVCNRVLDSCFNGIYEACGSHDGKTGPYNYNTTITVNNDGSDLNFVQAGSSAVTSTASCFGYSSTGGDPYSTLRTPVADSRRSIVQKYALDANADCDTYGEELKTQATNMAYQKIAATQYLQKKRLEFAQDEETQTAAELAEGKEKYRNCVNEIYDCYDQQTRTNPTWTSARIKNYCAQSAESPSCYETMICDQEVEVLIDLADNIVCNETLNWSANTCRNVTLLSEILNGTGAAAVAPGGETTANSRGLREYCLQSTPGVYGAGSIRDFGIGWGPGI